MDQDTEDIFPIKKGTKAARDQLTIRLRKDLHQDVDLIEELWTAFEEILSSQAKAAGDERDPSKWNTNSVIERLVEVGVRRFWRQAGGRPPTEGDREKWLAAALARLKKLEKMEQAKKRR